MERQGFIASLLVSRQLSLNSPHFLVFLFVRFFLSSWIRQPGVRDIRFMSIICCQGKRRHCQQSHGFDWGCLMKSCRLVEVAVAFKGHTEHKLVCFNLTGYHIALTATGAWRYSANVTARRQIGLSQNFVMMWSLFFFLLIQTRKQRQICLGQISFSE